MCVVYVRYVLYVCMLGVYVCMYACMLRYVRMLCYNMLCKYVLVVAYKGYVCMLSYVRSYVI